LTLTEYNAFQKTINYLILDFERFQLVLQSEGTNSEIADEVNPAAQAQYRFLVPQHEEEFSHPFSTGQTVFDARKMIATRCSLASPADVTLLLSGKTLPDRFVVNRLRIGDGSITACILDLSDILIVTARANRQDLNQSDETRSIPYRFAIPQPGIDELISSFTKGETVGYVKLQLAQTFSLSDSEYVTFLLQRKQLKDAFELNCLPFDNNPIVVKLRDDSDVLLISTRVFRT